MKNIIAYYEIKCYEMEKNNIVSKNEWLKMNLLYMKKEILIMGYKKQFL